MVKRRSARNTSAHWDSTVNERREQSYGHKSGSSLRVVLFGMHCAFTAPILAALAFTPGLDLATVVLPGRKAASARPTPDPVSTLVQDYQLPVIGVPHRAELASTGFRTALQARAPDVVVVACFPWRIPRSILTLPHRGCINVHPSLLADGRGPEPIFWAFRWRLSETGVTLHLMDEGFDAGPILAQRTREIAEDDTMGTLERSLAHLGAEMLVQHLTSHQARTSRAQPQNDTDARYAGFPKASDLVVPTSWSAREASRFIHAVSPVYGTVPVLVLATGQKLAVRQVLSFDDNAAINKPASVERNIATIRFSPGTLTCRINVATQPLHLFTNPR